MILMKKVLDILKACSRQNALLKILFESEHLCNCELKMVTLILDFVTKTVSLLLSLFTQEKKSAFKVAEN